MIIQIRKFPRLAFRLQEETVSDKYLLPLIQFVPCLFLLERKVEVVKLGWITDKLTNANLDMIKTYRIVTVSL